MKKVEAIIRPSRIDAVRNAVVQERGIEGLTVSEAMGVGREKGRGVLYRGTTCAVDLVARLKVEVVVRDEYAQPVAHAIVRAARTGRLGDGRVLIVPVVEAARIRTGEHGTDAIEGTPLG